MAPVVYVLCSFLSLACAILLYRGYAKNHARLLFWSALGFAGFAINNILLFIDMTIINQDFSVVRSIPAFLGTTLLLYGLIMEST